MILHQCLERNEGLHESSTTCLGKAVSNVSGKLSEACLQKRQSAARNQRWSERSLPLDLISCHPAVPPHPHPPPPSMPCHSCLAIVEQHCCRCRCRCCCYIASLPGLEYLCERGRSRGCPDQDAPQTMRNEIPDVQVCQMKKNGKQNFTNNCSQNARIQVT